MSDLISRNDAYLQAWKKAQRCRYPECDCVEVHSIINVVQDMAKRIGCEFVPDKTRMASTSFCKG